VLNKPDTGTLGLWMPIVSPHLFPTLGSGSKVFLDQNFLIEVLVVSAETVDKTGIAVSERDCDSPILWKTRGQKQPFSTSLAGTNLLHKELQKVKPNSGAFSTSGYDFSTVD
jgi:hypothetical protein